jgi:hypothetical protein
MGLILDCGELGRCEVQEERVTIDRLMNENRETAAVYIDNRRRLLRPLDIKGPRFWDTDDATLRWWKPEPPIAGAFLNCGALGMACIVVVYWEYTSRPKFLFRVPALVKLRFFKLVS